MSAGQREPARAHVPGATRRRRTPRGHVERTVRALLDAIDHSRASERRSSARGLLQRLDPRVKVAGLLSLVVAVTLSTNAATIAALLVLASLAAVVSGIRLRQLAAAVWVEVFLFTGAIAAPALFLTPGRAAFSVPPFPWPVTAPGLATAGLLLIRVETAATLAYLLVATTPWTHVLKALRVFHVPVVFVVVLGMTYRYILLLLETARDMFDAHRARAVVRPRGTARLRQVLGSGGVLLSKSMSLSGEVYLAMQARGFRGDVRLLDEFRMRALDWVALSSLAALAAAAVWAGR